MHTRKPRPTPPAISTPAPTLREPEAAQYLSMSRAFLREGRMKGRGPDYIKCGRRICYRVADLDKFLDQHAVRLERGDSAA